LLKPGDVTNISSVIVNLTTKIDWLLLNVQRAEFHLYSGGELTCHGVLMRRRVFNIWF